MFLEQEISILELLELFLKDQVTLKTGGFFLTDKRDRKDRTQKSWARFIQNKHQKTQHRYSTCANMLGQDYYKTVDCKILKKQINYTRNFIFTNCNKRWCYHCINCTDTIRTKLELKLISVMTTFRVFGIVIGMTMLINLVLTE